MSGGEADPGVGAALGAVRDAGLAAVRPRDQVDDREPEPGAAARRAPRRRG